MHQNNFAVRRKRAAAWILAAGMILAGMPGLDVRAANEVPGQLQTEQESGTIEAPLESAVEEPQQETENGDDLNAVYSTQVSGNDISGNDLTDYGEETEEEGNRVVGGYIELPEDRNVSVVDESARIYDYEDEIAPLMSGSLPEAYIPEPGTLPLTRDQNPYGSCWAHSAMALAEMDMRKNEGAPADADYSELHLAYFSYNGAVNDPLGGLDGDANVGVYNDTDAASFMDRGGNLSLAQYVLANWVGAADEKTAPYPPEKEKLSEAELEKRVSKDSAFTDVAHLQNAFRVNLQDDRNGAKRMIQQYGGVGTSYNEADEFYDGTHKSYYCNIAEKTNHAVTIVGWDDSFPKGNFKTSPEDNGAWLIRNSWSAGKDTGEEDRGRFTYFWMSYYDKSLAAGYAFDFKSADFYHHNYQYDGSMASAFLYAPADHVYAANVFTAKACEGGERLEAVGVAFEKANTPYTITIYKNLKDPANPESGEPVGEAAVSGTCAWEGFYTIPLGKPVSLALDDSFSVVVKYGALKEEPNTVYWPYEGSVSTWFRSTASAKPGQSFYKFEGGSWTDFGQEKKANFRIKAYTTDNGGTGEPTKIELGNGLIDGIEVGVGDTYQASCTVLPPSASDKSVNWVSDKPSVATVDADGLITGVSEGTATITVTCAAAASVKASFQVTVYSEPRSVQISYELDGGTNAAGNPLAYTSEDGSVSLQAPTKKGYDFEGWYTENTYENRKDSLSSSWVKNDITLYAKWSIHNYQITYNLYGGTNSAENPKTYNIGSGIITLKDAVKRGSIFEGWYSDLSYQQRVTQITPEDMRDITLYAKWQEETSVITAIQIKRPTRTTYKTGEELDISGGEVTCVSDQPGDAVPMSADMVSGFDSATAGICRVTVSFAGQTADFETLIVAEPQLNAVYGQRLGGLTLPANSYGSYFWKDAETVLDKAGVCMIPVSFVPDDEDAFQRLDDLYAQVTVADAPTDKVLENGVLTLQEESFRYTGAEQKPQVTLTVKGDLLVEGRDYTVGYYNNKNAGTATVVADGIGDYRGSISHTFTITPAELVIRAVDKTISAGGSIPGQSDYEYEVSGLLADDRLLKEPLFQCDVTEAGTQKEGRFMITPFGADAGPNYTIASYESGWLTVKGGYLVEIEDIYYYTGKAWKPAVNVYDGETRLEAGRDYTVKYFNNIHANAGGVWKKGSGQGADFNPDIPYVQITGKGDYTDEVKVNFDIHPAVIADEEGNPAEKVVLKYTDQFAAAEEVLKPFSSIRYHKAMKLNQDYTLKLVAEDVRDRAGNAVRKGRVFLNGEIPQGYVGRFQLTVTGIGNYDGIIQKPVYVTDKNHLMKNAKITLGKNQKSVELAGKSVELTPSTENSADTFTVKLGTRILTPQEDYEVSYLKESNRRVGKATLVITGVGDYSGTKTAAFTVKGKAFTAGKITVTGIENKIYTGSAITQNDVRLVYNAGKPDEKELKYGDDYMVSYEKNVDKGTASMTFTGSKERGYSGSFKKSFIISPAVIGKENLAAGWDTIVAAYSKAGAKPAAEIVLADAGGKRLQMGKDYTLSYKNNTFVADAGSERAPTVIVKGKGNYQGMISIPFTIAGADLRSKIDSGEITIKTTAVAYQPKRASNYAYKPTVRIMEGKKLLRSGADYTVTYLHNTQAEYEAYIKGDGTAPAPQAVITAGTDGTYLIKPSAETGQADISGISVPLTIYRNKLTKKNISVKVSECVYTGSQVKPKVEVSYQGENGWIVLTEKKDYTVSYGANTKSGKKAGQVTVSGMGALYGGDVTVNFEIPRKQITLY